MAANVPAKLKTADISRFALRAAQVEKAKPIVAYWCYYWIVNQILSRKLHSADAESMTYTTDLMDKLEQMKVQYAGNDAITDDMAGQAYVEQFGLETFQRADNAVRANKASKQTADTFQAAATFLDLSRIWGEPDPELAAKIKYAKFHALRIAKAIKAGEDPNLSNPKREASPAPEEPLDPNDLEVRLLAGTPPPNRGRPQQASVEDVTDEHDNIQPSLGAQSPADQSLHPSRQPSLPRSDHNSGPYVPTPPEIPPGEDYYSQARKTEHGDVSPMEPSPPNDRKGSVGGGYFPRVSSFTDEPPQPTREGPPRQTHPSSSYSSFASPPPLDSPTHPPDPKEHNFFSQPGNLGAPSPPAQKPHPSYQLPYHPAYPTQSPSQPPPPPQSYYYPPHAPQPPPQQTSYHSTPVHKGEDNLVSDDAAILLAQKHARWAISALNFEDVKTAVKELRTALEALGART